MDRVISSVLKTSAVKTLHLSFCRKNDDNHDELNLVRPSPWRSLLSQDVLLNLWSWLLAETKTWSGAEKSHTSRDIIVFLVKKGMTFYSKTFTVDAFERESDMALKTNKRAVGLVCIILIKET